MKLLIATTAAVFALPHAARRIWAWLTDEPCTRWANETHEGD